MRVARMQNKQSIRQSISHQALFYMALNELEQRTHNPLVLCSTHRGATNIHAA
jgi:hypothetical protein